MTNDADPLAMLEERIRRPGTGGVVSLIALSVFAAAMRLALLWRTPRHTTLGAA